MLAIVLAPKFRGYSTYIQRHTRILPLFSYPYSDHTSDTSKKRVFFVVGLCLGLISQGIYAFLLGGDGLTQESRPRLRGCLLESHES